MEHTGLYPAQGTALSDGEVRELLRDGQSPEGNAAGFRKSRGGVLEADLGEVFPLTKSDATRLFPEHFMIGALMLGSFVSGALALFH